jgi:hypothetical protein
VIRALALVIVLAGCAGPASMSTVGPVTVALGSREWVRRTCRIALHLDTAPLLAALVWDHVRGCVVLREGKIAIYCPVGDAECIAHEIRHAIDPLWTHSPFPGTR